MASPCGTAIFVSSDWIEMQKVLATGLIGLVIVAVTGWDAAAQHRYEVLVFSKTEGFRHRSVEAGVEAIKALGAENNFGVHATEDAGYFHADSLEHFEAIVFLNTTLDILDSGQEAAMMDYIQSGGGWVGVHAAADTEYDWEWYGGLVGGYFASHPAVQPADIVFTDRLHPSTKDLPLVWNHTDEWYNYEPNPRANVHVLAVIRESSYEGGTMGDDHPIAWAHHYDGGRAWYTGLGHTVESYAEPYMRTHLLGGIEWAAGFAEADVTATLASAYDEVVLTTELTDPMEIDITSDGRVFIIEWAGSIKIWEPATGAMRVIGWLPVDKNIEDGLLGLALDPQFDDNQWVYIYYSVIPDGPKKINRLSRFVYDGHMLDMDSEISMLEIPVQRATCCHSGGSVQFDKDGLLYLSTGDNSGGDRNSQDPDLRRMADQGRTSANTNDLRGKILRIKPEPDGTYSIPEGNLFEADSLHRGEIYTMGHRNPFRISIDDSTGWVYWGDVGPGLVDGWDEFNQAQGPGFYGWPLFTGYNDPYPHYHLAEKEYVEPNAAAPLNESEYNTGARELHEALPAWIRYYYGPSEEYPELGAGGLNPMAGPTFHFDEVNAFDTAFPPYYNGKVMIYEWMRNWVKIVTIDEDGSVLEIDPFLPGNDYIRPMDIEVGPHGRLYIIEWGDEFWGSNANAQLVRLDYYGASGPPEPEVPEMPPARSLSLDWPLDGGVFDFDSTYTYRVTVNDQARADEVIVRIYTGFDTSPIPLATYTRPEGEFLITHAYTHNPDLHYADRFAIVEACLDSSCARAKLHPRLKEAEHATSAEKSVRKTYSARPASKHWGRTALTAMPLENGTSLTYNPINLQGINRLTFRFRATGTGTILLSAEGSEIALPSIPISPDTGQAVVPHQADYTAGVPPDFPGMGLLAEDAYDNWREVSVEIPPIPETITLMLTFESAEEDPVVELDWIRFEDAGFIY